MVACINVLYPMENQHCAAFKLMLWIKTHDSESRGQEAAIIRETKITRPLSELFTSKTAKKIANALAKLP